MSLFRSRARLALLVVAASAICTLDAVAQVLPGFGGQLPPALQLPGGMPLPAGGRAGLPDPTALGAEAERNLDFAKAAEHYRAAVDQARRAPPMLATERLRATLPRYAQALLVLGRLEDAEATLVELNALPEAPREFNQVARVLQQAMAIGRGAAAAMNQRLVVDSDAAETIAAALRPRLPATAVAPALMAELRARQGRVAEVVDIWSGPFQSYLADVAARDPQLEMAFLEEAAVASWRMGLALQTAGARAEAMAAFKRASALNVERLRLVAEQVASVDAQLGGFQQQRSIASAAGQLAAERGSDAPAALHAVAELVAAKGLANRYLGHRRALVNRLTGWSAGSVRNKLAALDAELPTLRTDGAEGVAAFVRWSNEYGKTLQPVLAALNEAGLSSVLDDPKALLERVRRGLAKDEALVGYIAVQPLTLQRPAASPQRYLRYTLVDGQASIQDLGARRDIDALVSTWRSSPDAARREAAAATLSTVLLGGLPAEVLSAPRWVVDPDMLLALLPFEALPDPNGRMVLDQRSVRYVSSAAQLGDASPKPARTSGTAVVMADPHYPGGPLAPTPALAALRVAGGAEWRDVALKPLPETRQEAEAVAKAVGSMGLSPRVLLGADATPSELAKVEHPAVLHVASHGLLLSPAPGADLVGHQRVRMLVPGQLAALALTPDAQGPLFTAGQLQSLDLVGTRLVVLSACDTGNGAMDVHEGLSSLRRAAEEAGAAATLTSLWPAPSQATVTLMSRFYQGLAAGKTNVNALRDAKLALRNAGARPADWAGFVLAGAEQ